MRKIVVDPVSRIEGHGKITVTLDDDNRVVDAHLSVVEFRGFERMIQGHPFWEAPMLMQRVCGICFVSHHMCGAKTLDDMVGVGYAQGIHPTPVAEKMRRLGHYAQQLQSHVTAYFYLLAPEMLFGMDAPPEQRNILGLVAANPELVKRVIEIRKWGQELLVAIFGKRMHGIQSIPGGVNNNLSIAQRDRFINGDAGIISLAKVMEYAWDSLNVFKGYHQAHRDQVDRFAVVPALNMCLVDDNGNADYYHGRLRITDANKNIVDEFDYHDYLSKMSEDTEPWSYMKFPYLTALGREAGSVRVGPLARMNITQTLTTPLAAAELAQFHDYTHGKANDMTLHTNWARAIEIINTAELIQELLLDPDLQSEQLVLNYTPAQWTGEGVGVVEAPRGVLLHHYKANREGAMTNANLIVATTQNNQVMNRTLKAVADEYLNGQANITEGMMNALEVGLRAYDPCLSCATHAAGQMPLQVTLVNESGQVIDEHTRG